MANLFADWRAARLARDDNSASELIQSPREPLGLRRFPATFGAFKRDEEAARHVARLLNDGRELSNTLQFRVANYWLVKSEPSAYSWDDLVREGETSWTGVRNFMARKNLRAMRKGDKVLFYHSVTEKAVVGVATVTRAAYSDPTAKEGDWAAVDLKPKRGLARAVSLDEIKGAAKLKDMTLLRCGRLSVQALGAAEFREIVRIAG